jgi:DNA-binding transcriptional regulator LsrR (DeoR family)
VSSSRPRRLLAEAARLYYVDGLSQEQIAHQLSMTRSNVSRVLRAARDSGVVEIRIRDFEGRDGQLEEALARQFGLGLVAVAAGDETADTAQRVGELGAEVILDELSGASIAAVSWGTTVQAVVAALPQMHFPDLQIVQLVGGLVSFDARATAHDVVRDLAHRLDSRYRYLNSPAVFDSPEALRQLVKETSVSETLAMARKAELALVGIGSPYSGSSATLIRLLNLGTDDMAELWSANPVGDVCGRYYDLRGRPLDCPGLRDRILAISLEDLAAIPSVVGVAWGAEKGPAVLGALRGGLLDVLVCDEALARAVLDIDGHPD